MSDSSATRPMRADARRNYQRLLDQARTTFAERGTDASLEEIARRAGVGIGTLYRHFPSRDALLEAVLRDRLDGLAARAAELDRTLPPREALAEWLRAFVAGANTYRGLTATLVTTLSDPTSQLYAACHAMRAAGERLLTNAQQAGQVRQDVTALDLFILVNGVAWAADQVLAAESSRVDRLLSLVLDGLAPR